MAAEEVADPQPSEDQSLEEKPTTKLLISPTYVEITVGQTISTGDYGSIRPEFKAGFKVPPGVDVDSYVQDTLYPWVRWCFIWLVRKQLLDHTGLRDNIHQWVSDFFKKFSSAPNLIVTARKALVAAAQKITKAK
jgi:hypothetical protein